MNTVNNGVNQYSSMDDAELVVLCQQQKEAAFEELFKRHQRGVQAMLYKLAPDWNNCADLSQEAFIRIWKGVKRLQNPKAFKSWMYHIVTNLFYDELRKRPRNTSLISLDAPRNGDDDNSPTRDLVDPSSGPSELYDRKHMR